MDMVKNSSVALFDGERIFATEPQIENKTWENAISMEQQRFKAFKAKQSNSNYVVYTIPSSNCESANASESYYKTLVRTQWKSFDEFVKYGFQQFWIVRFAFENWKTQSTCTCPAFFKQFICKHIIAVGIRLKEIQIPETINPVRIVATRKKPGRPAKSAKALIVQN